MRSAGRKPKHERKVGPEERRGRGSGSARPPEQESAAWAELNIVEEGDEPEEDSEAEETEAPREKRGRFRRHWKHRLKRRPAFSSVHDFLNSLLSFRLLFEVFVQKVRWLFAVGVVCTLGFMFVLTTVKSFGASTTMSLNYEESVTGKTPNGARFSESEFLTQEYLEAILQATGLQGRPDDRRPRGLHLHQPHHQPDRDQGGRLLHQLVLLSLGQAAVDALGEDHGAGLPRRDMPGIPQAVHRRLPGQRHLAGHRR